MTAGTYTVTVTDASGCSKTATAQVLSVLGVNSIKDMTNLIIAPNPSSGNLRVTADFAQNINLHVFITNVLGQIMYSRELTETKNLNLSLDVSLFANGIYFLTLKTKESQQTQKIIVEK